MKILVTNSLSVLLIISFAVSQAFGCACCVEKGARFQYSGDFDEYPRSVVSGMKYAKSSELFIDVAGFESIRGLDAYKTIFESDEGWKQLAKLDTKVVFDEKGWTFEIGAGEASGKLGLAIPEKVENFGVDIHDNRGSSGGGPLIYKEMRFRGRISSGSGVFAASAASGPNYELIFQGRGNGCSNTEDFTHWRLSVEGNDVRYTFLGILDSGEPSYFFEKKDEASSGPSLSDYPATPWTGTPSSLKLGSHEQARNFRTRLREAHAEGVNFAGSFILTYWGCGSNCLYGAVIDGRTGRVYFPDELGGIGVGLPGFQFEGEAIEFSRDSNLLIIRGALAQADKPGTTWLLWEGKGFKRLKFEEPKN